VRDWWKGFFQDSVYPLADLLDEDSTAGEVRRLIRLLPKGASILDVACGVGRHSIPLSQKGFQVTGIDYSISYLAEAKRRAQAVGAPVRFLRKDMRDIGFQGGFDVVLNLWTSFGYFQKITDDRRTLKSMRQALAPGGRLLLEVVDPARFAGGFPERYWARVGDYWQLEATRLRLGRDPAMTAERHYIGPDGKARSGNTFVRLYSRRRLRAELERAGFMDIHFSCGLMENPRKPELAARILAMARRPS
jgi:SAM-dependent methyltransferase